MQHPFPVKIQSIHYTSSQSYKLYGVISSPITFIHYCAISINDLFYTITFSLLSTRTFFQIYICYDLLHHNSQHQWLLHIAVTLLIRGMNVMTDSFYVYTKWVIGNSLWTHLFRHTLSRPEVQGFSGLVDEWSHAVPRSDLVCRSPDNKWHNVFLLLISIIGSFVATNFLVMF